MPTSINNFTSEKQLTTAALAMVSSGASDVRFIGKATVTNTSILNVEVTVWRLLTATTPTTGSGANWIWKETIPAGKTVRIDKIEGHVLGRSMSIFALAATTLVINFDCSGMIET